MTSSQKIVRICSHSQQCRPTAAGLAQLGEGALQSFRVFELFYIEVLLERAQHGRHIKSSQAEDHSVRRQYHQSWRLHIYKRHHYPFITSTRRITISLAHLVAVIQRGLVPMMAIGDDELLVCHSSLNPRNCGRIRHPPQPMSYRVLIGNLNMWWA